MDSDKNQGTNRNSTPISVIMPCFNAGPFLREAVESVLAQTYGAVELIVVDDGSTDASLSILQSYGKRIRVIRQANQGPYPARNAGLRTASGNYVAFLDADDYWSINFLEKLHNALVHTEAVLAYCGWQNVGDTHRNKDPFVPPDYDAGNKLEAFLRAASPWPIHAALVRKCAIDEIGGFDESLESCMDYDLWLRLAALRPVVRVPEVLAFYRFHQRGQITSKEWIQARNAWLVKRKFLRDNRQVTNTLPADALRDLIDGGLANRAYRAYWQRDLVSARKIFRMLLRTGHWQLKDLKFILPAMLPESVYARLISLADRGRN